LTGTSRGVDPRSRLQCTSNTPTAPSKPGGAPFGSGRTFTVTGLLCTVISRRGTRPKLHEPGSLLPSTASASEAMASPTVAGPAASGYSRARVSVTSTRRVPSAAKYDSGRVNGSAQKPGVAGAAYVGSSASGARWTSRTRRTIGWPTYGCAGSTSTWSAAGLAPLAPLGPAPRRVDAALTVRMMAGASSVVDPIDARNGPTVNVPAAFAPIS